MTVAEDHSHGGCMQITLKENWVVVCVCACVCCACGAPMSKGMVYVVSAFVEIIQNA